MKYINNKNRKSYLAINKQKAMFSFNSWLEKHFGFMHWSFASPIGTWKIGRDNLNFAQICVFHMTFLSIRKPLKNRALFKKIKILKSQRQIWEVTLYQSQSPFGVYSTLGWSVRLYYKGDSRCEFKSTGFACQIAVTKI